jgi:hypothetical protein
LDISVRYKDEDIIQEKILEKYGENWKKELRFLFSKKSFIKISSIFNNSSSTCEQKKGN